MTTAPSSKVNRAADTLGRPGGRCGEILAVLVPRLRPFLITALTVWMLFNGFRVGLLLHSKSYVDDVGPKTVARCLLLGMGYDAMPMGYMFLPMGLALLIVRRRTFDRKWFRRAMTIYGTAVIALVIVAEVIGAAFFLRYTHRLNCIALNYLDRPAEIGTHIWEAYPVLWLLAGAIVASYLAYRMFARLYWPKGPVAAGRAAAVPGGRRVRIRAVAAVVLLCAGILACRGGMGRHPLRRGSAYDTRNKVIAQLTMNNFYTFFYAARANLDEGLQDPGPGPLPDFDAAAQVTSALLYQPADRPAAHGTNPLWRRTETDRPRRDYNVVLIIMEGMSGKYCGALGYRTTETPVLDGMADEGLFFDRMYAVGARTSRGLIGVLAGHPDLGGKPIIRRRNAWGRFLTLPSIFQGRGYRTMFLYGGDPSFDDMREFLSRDGVDEVLGREQMAADAPGSHWGVHDEVLFQTAHEKFQSMGDEPFFATLLTISNHEPYDVPAGRVEMLPGAEPSDKKRNAYRYADWALGEFFREARTAAYFRRTIFVMVADHGHGFDNRRMIDVPGYRVPCLIYAPHLPEVVPVARVETVCSQTDVAPTLLAMLGGSYEHGFLGRNVLGVPAGEGFALLHEDDRLAAVRGDRALVLLPGEEGGWRTELYRTGLTDLSRLGRSRAAGNRANALKRSMLSYYKVAQHLWQSGAYCRPALAAMPMPDEP